MDFETLENIFNNMPKTYEEMQKNNPQMAEVIQQEIILDALIKHGIFKDKNDFFQQCKKRYTDIRNETEKQLKTSVIYSMVPDDE